MGPLIASNGENKALVSDLSDFLLEWPGPYKSVPRGCPSYMHKTNVHIKVQGISGVMVIDRLSVSADDTNKETMWSAFFFFLNL